MNIADVSVSFKEAIIPDGAGKKTPAIDLEWGNSPVGIFHPAIDTSTAFTFEASRDGTTFVPVEDGAGAAESVTIDNTQAGYVLLDWTKFLGFKWLKVVVANNQTGAKTLYVATRPIL